MCDCVIATEGLDFPRLSRTVTLTPTDAQQCVIVTIEDDSELEETESLIVSVSLTGIVDSVLLTQHTASISIVDNESKCPFVPYFIYIVWIYGTFEVCTSYCYQL